jgi:hypothetical protein
MTIVDRVTRCILDWTVNWHPSWEVMPPMVYRSHKARHYFSDAILPYNNLVYPPATQQSRQNKQETYALETVNSDLRHYLAQVARRSQYFSRSIDTLTQAVKLLVYCYNQRQLRKRDYPKYTYHLINFI